MGRVYQEGLQHVRDYPDESIAVSNALIEPGQKSAQVKLAKLSQEECQSLILKLDQLAMSRQHEGIAIMVAEELANIITAVRMVKDETKAAFAGMLGSGSNLDIFWLRPRDIGDIHLNGPQTAMLGIYGSALTTVFTWLNTFVANTSQTMVPNQIMDRAAACIHLGAIDQIAVPKLNAIQFTLSAIPAPPQSLPFTVRGDYGTETPFVRFEKPIIVGPRRSQQIDVMPYIDGDSRFELLSFAVATAETIPL